MHVHLENLTSKPRIFWLTRDLVDTAVSHAPDLKEKVRFTVDDDLADIEAKLSTATALVTSSDVIRHPRFPKSRLSQAAPQLKFIHLIGAGVDSVMPLDWLPSGIQLTNNSGAHADKAREFLLMALLALNARLPEIIWNQRHSRWDQLFTPLIRGKSLCVVGLGDLGRAAVAAGQTLGLKIHGVRHSGQGVPGVERVYLPSQLHEALGRADFVVLATPLTPQTKGFIDREALASIKPGGALINVGRAGILDHDALIDMLEQGHLSNAIIDVLPEEPLPAASPLWSTPNLIVNPHVAADDLTGYMAETMKLVCANLQRHLAGRALQNVVDPAKEY